MSNSIMRGAYLSHVVIQSNESGTFCRLNVRADYSDSVREENGWQELGINSKFVDLIGEMPAGRLALTSQQILTNGSCPELRIAFDSIGTFRAVRVKAKDQESSRVELRFHIRSSDPNAAGLCQGYKRDAKKTLGELRISDGKEVEEERPPANPDGQLTIAEGMKIVKGDKKKNKGTRGQLTAAVAEVSVEISPEERERLDTVIEQSLN